MSVTGKEFEFTLPIGYVDAEGTLHRDGVMRLATAGDEMLPLKDHRVQANPAYLAIIILSRVVVRLGRLDMINTKVIEGLFAQDFAYLQQFYNQINQVDGSDPAGRMRDLKEAKH
ncbi:hypothetical protein DWU98_12910 [Dyella monticola]|uniref:Phage tail assembly protein n=1 Tax=Dyella monticola TaxID=1927958 RepID=A0A370WXK4_9GAMM|nr:hypothetical protein [Dyella monticola]RDS80842.1 hypothetical protein DWU98_12910 [Dyella monticola]